MSSVNQIQVVAKLCPMFDRLQNTIAKAQKEAIAQERLLVLNTLVDYCQLQLASSESLKLNFICTHNSRRSQFSQVWAQVAAHAHGIRLESYSGGVEVTAFNERAIASLKRLGFQITSEGNDNPLYIITYSSTTPPIQAFSKLYDDNLNPKDGFAAIMTCSDADENCPFIPGASARIPLRYEDPKAFDDTPEESRMYDERSTQIASEMFYVFSQLSI